MQVTAHGFRTATTAPLNFAGIGFSSVESTDARAWWEATAGPAGRPVLARLVERVPFHEALLLVVDLINLQDEPLPTAEGSLAVVVIDSQAAVVAAAIRDDAGFSLPVDGDRASSLKPDDPVSIVVIYPRRGEPVLRSGLSDPRSAAAQLETIAGILDHLASSLPEGTSGHGSLDVPCLRIDGDLPVIVGTGLTKLITLDRERREDADPWKLVPCEHCLPPVAATNAGDQYTLATLWHWSRSGVPPVTGTTAAEVMRNKLSSESPEVIPIGAEGDVIRQAIAPDPGRRFESISQFVAAISAALAEALPPPSDEARPFTRRTTVSSDAEVGEAAAAVAEAPDAAEQKEDWDVDTSPTMAANVIEPQTSEAASPPKPRVASLPASEPPPKASSAMPQAAADATPPPAAAASATPSPPAPARAPATRPPAAQPAIIASYPYRPGDQILPDYRLTRKLGQGGFGEVWQATAPGGMGVAIKVITNLGRQQGSREYRALKTVRDIRHAHIVPLFGVWLKAADGRVLDATEAETISQRLLAGSPALRQTTDRNASEPLDSLELVVAMGLGDETLHDVLARHTKSGEQGVPLPQLLVWMRQTALAIDHFNQGQRPVSTMPIAVQHCDIKPQNMLLVGGMVQVCDFGLAREQGEVRATANNLASMAYAAPEMLNKPYDPSPTTDQYSLAISYIELRTGQLPYPDQSPLDVLKAKLSGTLDLSLVPDPERSVLERALALDPADRWGSCGAFVDALARAAEGTEASRPAGPTVVGTERKSGSNRPIPWLAAAGFASAAAVMAGLLYVLLLPPEQVPGVGSPRETVRGSQPPAPSATVSLRELIGRAEKEAAGGRFAEAVEILAQGLASAGPRETAADTTATRTKLFGILADWAESGSAAEAVRRLEQLPPASTAADLLQTARIYRADVRFDREASALTEAARLDPDAVRVSGMVDQLIARAPAEAASAHASLVRTGAAEAIVDVFAGPMAESILATVRESLAAMKEIDASALAKVRGRIQQALELGHDQATPLLGAVDAAIDLERTLAGLAKAPPATLEAQAAHLSALEDWQQTWPSQAKLLGEPLTAPLSKGLADGLRALESQGRNMRQKEARRQAADLVQRAKDRLDSIPTDAPPADVQALASASEADCLQALTVADEGWPEAWLLYSELGRAENFLQKFKAAAEHLEQAIDLLGRLPDQKAAQKPLEIAHGRRGFARAELHRWQEAAADHAIQYRDDPANLVQLLWHFQDRAIHDTAATPPPGVTQAIAILEQLESVFTAAGETTIADIHRWEVQTTLAWWLSCGPTATPQTGQKAIPIAEQALTACGEDPRDRANVLDTLAAAQARAGDFAAAIAAIDQAAELDPSLAADLQERRKKYAAGEAWSERP